MGESDCARLFLLKAMAFGGRKKMHILIALPFEFGVCGMELLAAAIRKPEEPQGLLKETVQEKLRELKLCLVRPGNVREVTPGGRRKKEAISVVGIAKSSRVA